MAGNVRCYLQSAKPSVGGWLHRREKYLTPSQVSWTNESEAVAAGTSVCIRDRFLRRWQRARDQAEWLDFGLLALWRLYASHHLRRVQELESWRGLTVALLPPFQPSV
jgi:hypothetical protein